ncbi:MAG: T9SS type A sorting domain-containing protein [bacterium]|nr:T9SS type A sorting domain-containing protein [bacterium]
MKRIFVLLFVLAFAFSLFAMPSTDALAKIRQTTSVSQDGKFLEVKDDDANAAGMTAILELGGDMRGFAPTPLQSIVSSQDGQTIQVVSGLFSGGGFVGVYYTASLNGGATWSTPTLISSAGPFARNYNELAVATGEYPYVIINYRTTNYWGDWFTTDILGPNGGGWTSPTLVTDTANYLAYMPSIAVNPDGDKCVMIAYDVAGGFGSNYSIDYGATWGTYDWPADLNTDTLWGIDVSCVRWGNGDDVHAIFGMVWKDETRSDILASGPGSAIVPGYAYTTDLGATWNAYTGLFEGNIWPNVNTLNGDTVIYNLDTTANATNDAFPVKAYLDATTGGWTDELGTALGDGFGTWWYWWDAEYYTRGTNGVMAYVVPLNDLFVDYYENGDLYTFVWQGQSFVFGYKFDGETDFRYDYIDIHDADVLDETGATATWRGNAYSANLCYDQATDNMYIVYLDYVDTATGISSVEALKLDPATNGVYRTTIILNAGLYEVECGKYVDDNGYIHIAGVAGSEDSIYYKAVDINDAGLVWEDLGVTTVWGMNNEVSSNFKNNIYNIPSFVGKNGSISFVMNEGRNVEISVYDATGRNVNTINKFFSKGTHSVNLNLKQGVYFVKVNDGVNNFTKKVVSVK